MKTAPVRDPVCGMAVNPLEPPATARYNQETFHFCSEACKRLFEESPDTYVPGPGQKPASPETNK